MSEEYATHNNQGMSEPVPGTSLQQARRCGMSEQVDRPRMNEQPSIALPGKNSEGAESAAESPNI